MRTIKFRGKMIDAGEWVYGYYVKHQTHTLAPIRPKKTDPTYQHLILQSGFSDWNMPKPLDMHEVLEETVGQFTGLLDKNGKEIYEGDILKHDLWEATTVIWDHDGACFRGNSDERDMTLSHHQLQRSRVIGNIYEHKHLLEGAKDE